MINCRISPQGDVVTLSVSFPEEGQYGMDIYTREVTHGSSNGDSGNNSNGGATPGAAAANEKHLLTHCCKYLINSSRRNNQ